MEIVFVLLPLALALSGAGLALFVWAVRSGQFDDLEGPRWRILYDDPPTEEGGGGGRPDAGGRSE